MQQRLDTPDDRARPDDEFPESERHPELEAARPSVPRLPGFAAQLIGQRMRAMYENIAQEPVPDDLLELVRKLEGKEESE
ncbi:NepR family anti-sigma factor [Hyphomicrobium sp.]|uniref:NepR family anti-sigma factor n=1 Tax=Hyphomicrobium sp. TaxID=82 RepID=UPI002D78168E|nr:NepR family anti-sigma factor [Hyphomicrobium sp.]HET6389078.1 NepR family anti-sigma factor [Hyphomicrobium sp.]